MSRDRRRPAPTTAPEVAEADDAAGPDADPLDVALAELALLRAELAAIKAGPPMLHASYEPDDPEAQAKVIEALKAMRTENIQVIPARPTFTHPLLPGYTFPAPVAGVLDVHDLRNPARVSRAVLDAIAGGATAICRSEGMPFGVAGGARVVVAAIVGGFGTRGGGE